MNLLIDILFNYFFTLIKMKILRVLLFFFALPYTFAFAQGYDEERINLAMFIERMYNNEPFDGCRIVDDYDNSYMLAVVTLDPTKYKNRVAMNRVAEVKSQRVAGEFFNGSQSYTEMVIRTPKSEEKGGDSALVETMEIIKVNSIGFVRQMQLLTSFDGEDNTKVYVYYKLIDKNNLINE